MNNINQTLKAINLNGSLITLKVVSDDQAEMDLAYRLWYEVQVGELKYPVTVGVNHDTKQIRITPNGSLVFMAIENGICIGTIRTTWDGIAALEFNYKQFLPDTSQAELTKLMILRAYRHTHLLMHLYLNTFHFHEQNMALQPYENIVFSANSNMVSYYKIIGHKLLSEQIQTHPVIKTECYLMGCSRKHFNDICIDGEKIVNGNFLLKAKWGLRYVWYKKFKLFNHSNTNKQT